MAVRYTRVGTIGLGQIGNGTITDADDGLVQVLGVGGSGNLTGITQIAIAYASSLALKSDGTMYSWGNNTDGQNGLGTVGGTNPIYTCCDNITYGCGYYKCWR